ncbi:hypothetical protein PYW08_001396 [Mythimna loreyi]|uniref:Uncharacterized protein n=1 Tax=Mythimna loreyi TaxID=667449 RepID=A0ACC2R432_9NEOP|nr:hypothetical protein PYW08_001396 [Mythimna loreyi]
MRHEVPKKFDSSHRSTSKGNSNLVMTKARHSITDSEIGSIRTDRASKLGAILCPTVCALLLVCIFAVSFIGTKLAYDQYDQFCTSRRFDVAKLYIFPNITIKTHPVQVEKMFV